MLGSRRALKVYAYFCAFIYCLFFKKYIFLFESTVLWILPSSFIFIKFSWAVYFMLVWWTCYGGIGWMFLSVSIFILLALQGAVRGELSQCANYYKTLLYKWGVEEVWSRGSDSHTVEYCAGMVPWKKLRICYCWRKSQKPNICM